MSCFEFCRGPTNSPVAKILSTFGGMLFDADGEGREALLLLYTRYGPTSEWPLALTAELQGALVCDFSQLWRTMFVVFQSYPWRLAPAFDPESSEEEGDRCLTAFLEIPKGPRILDSGLAREVR